jgi:hypothetical protein
MAKVVVLKEPEPEAPPPDALESRRAALMAEAAKLNRVAEARAEIERRLAELDAEQAALDDGERQAWRVWATNDAEGPPPPPRAQERESIAQRRTLIANDLSGVLAGQKAIEPRLQALHAELHGIQLKIYERQADALIAEAEEVNAAVHAAAQAFVAAAERADGLRDSVVQALERAANGNDRGREAILRAAFSRLERFEQPKMAGDAGERSRHAADYRRRLA